MFSQNNNDQQKIVANRFLINPLGNVCYLKSFCLSLSTLRNKLRKLICCISMYSCLRK